MFESLFLMANSVFYTMEMRHLLFGSLDMIIGEIGPVELELLISSIMIGTGLVGSDKLLNTVGSTFALDSSNMIAEYKWNFVIGVIVAPLVPLFIGENLGPCFAQKPLQSFWLFFPIL